MTDKAGFPKTVYIVNADSFNKAHLHEIVATAAYGPYYVVPRLASTGFKTRIPIRDVRETPLEAWEEWQRECLFAIEEAEDNLLNARSLHRESIAEIERLKAEKP